jgi:myo-inositol-1(or 4)-monophosphatase
MATLIDRALAEHLGNRLPVIVDEVMALTSETYDKGTAGLDFVTSVDLAMQARLERELVAMLPGSQVKGEEGFVDTSSNDIDAPLWLVDPLDGTVNFVAGLPCYAVSVALLIEGRAALAVVYDIRHRITYSALAGKGAFVDGKPLVPRVHRAKLAALSSGLLRDLSANAPAVLGLLLSDFKLRNFGSQALHLCYAAAGHLALVANREARGWDDLAGALIAREAGLDYGHYYGGVVPLIGEEQYSLCTSPELFSVYSRELAKSIG